MITEVTMIYPENEKQFAEIVFDVLPETGTLKYKQLCIKGILPKDISFLHKVFEKIKSLNGRTLKSYIKKDEMMSGTVPATKATIS